MKGVVANFGISHDPDSYSALTHNLFEFQEIWRDVKQAPTWKARFMYVFGPPGWRHDGTGKTSKQMQAELKAEREAEKRSAPKATPVAAM